MGTELALSQRLAWFRAITQGLAQIHNLGLLHRDLKASNVLLRADNTPVLLDFGVESQLLLGAGFLRENEIYCTPFYVSPERVVGEPASVQSDLYALGVLFYELLTGEKPFVGNHLADILQKHLFDPIPELPGKLQVYQPLLSRLLAKSPERRPDSADDVLSRLDACEVPAYDGT
ncbi:MAG: serine/threonine-protein kinase [Thiolinea sp.]